MQIFEDVLAEMEQSVYMLQGSAEKSLEMVLRYLHVTGNSLKLSRDCIYTMNKGSSFIKTLTQKNTFKLHTFYNSTPIFVR